MTSFDFDLKYSNVWFCLRLVNSMRANNVHQTNSLVFTARDAARILIEEISSQPLMSKKSQHQKVTLPKKIKNVKKENASCLSVL